MPSTPSVTSPLNKGFLKLHPNVRKYVLVFGVTNFYDICHRRVLVVRKPKSHLMHPDMVNLPGGKLLKSETYQEAALRTLTEETGLAGSFPEPMGCMFSREFNYYIEVWRALVPPKPELAHNEYGNDTDGYSYHHGKDGQKAWWTPVQYVVNRFEAMRCVHDLQVIVPLCIMGVTGWGLKQEPLSGGGIIAKDDYDRPMICSQLILQASTYEASLYVHLATQTTQEVSGDPDAKPVDAKPGFSWPKNAKESTIEKRYAAEQRCTD